MHEASIVESLIRQVAQHKPPRAAVHRVYVRVGRLTNISTDALKFYFEALREDFPGEQCELTVNRPWLAVRCQNCECEQTLREWTWECPTCKLGPLLYVNGSELELEAMDVEDDDEDNSHR